MRRQGTDDLPFLHTEKEDRMEEFDHSAYSCIIFDEDGVSSAGLISLSKQRVGENRHWNS